MTAHLVIFLRGFVIVTLTSINVGQIAGRHWGGAFLGGVGISFVWWINAHTAAHSDARLGRECYALGAGVGTVTGMLIVQAVYG